jgi:hypothetical protein
MKLEAVLATPVDDSGFSSVGDRQAFHALLGRKASQSVQAVAQGKLDALLQERLHRPHKRVKMKKDP